MRTDYKKLKADTVAVTRNLREFDEKTDNIYESVVIMSKRANQIATEIKDELVKKIQEFNSSTDSLDEVFENREQIEVARYYEQIPKPTLLAVAEFQNHQIYYKSDEASSLENV